MTSIKDALKWIPEARAVKLPSLFLLLAMLALVACEKELDRPLVEVAGDTMGTTYTVKLVSDKGDLPEAEVLSSWAESEFAAVNQSMSTYIDDSELSLLNRADESWQPVSSPLLEVLSYSQEISRKSGGAFDFTVMPLVNLWGFGPQRRDAIPDPTALAQAMERIGYNKVSIDRARSAVKKPREVTIDLSAIAKGYAADQLAIKLRTEGYQHFMVEVGGELVLAGHNATGKPWRIGIETPSDQLLGARKTPIGIVDLSGKAMATSGDYRNYYEVDGVRFSHTLDPSTGRPITHNLASVTVIADTGAEADGWATALNVLGAERTLALAEREQLAVFLLVREGKGFKAKHSSKFEDYLAQ